MMIGFWLKQQCRLVAVVALLASAASLAFGQVVPQITRDVDVTQRTVLSKSVSPLTTTAKDMGRADGGLQMKDMLLRLQPTAAQQAALTKFVEDVQNPSSGSYHKWLKPSEFGARFGVADADVQKISAWLETSGLQVEEVAAGKGWIRFSGTNAQVENAFGTEVHSYSIGGKVHYANAKQISIPDALAPAIRGLVSLNNFEKAPLHTALAQVKRGKDGKLVRTSTNLPRADNSGLISSQNTLLDTKPNFTSQANPEQTLLAPADFSKIYDTASLISGGNDGTGVSIAIVGRSDISLSDVEAFRTVFNLPFNDPTFINANEDPGVVPGDDEEAILDVEWSGAVAPKAQIQYVIGSTTTTTDGVDIAASYIVDHALAPIMSVSFGLCEQAISQDELEFYSEIWQQASAEGISVMVSAGDSGSSSCDVPSEYLATPYAMGVSGLASTPYNTAVGGTEFNDANLSTYWSDTNSAGFSSAKGYIPEMVWNESCNDYLPVGPTNCYFDPTAEGTYAGGGGASNCSVHPEGDTPNIVTGLYQCQSGYPKPSWQTGTGVPADGARDVPDVSLAAAGIHDGYLICYDGSCQYTKNSDGSITLTQASIIGGTSAAAPSMAGVMALVEQKNGTFQGLANYKLYQLAAQKAASCDSSAQTDPTQGSACIFHDVTSGSNALSCSYGSTDCTVDLNDPHNFGLLSGYSATAGYDPASGLGSVDVANLVAAWGATSSLGTKTALAVSKSTFTHGTPVRLGVEVTATSGSGTPSGAVDLIANGNTSSLGPVAALSLNAAGKYLASVSSLPGGTYQLTAQYGGNGTYAASTSAPVSLTVTPEASTLNAETLVLSRFFILGRQRIVQGSSTGLNANFYISIQVAGNSMAGVPTGSISISDGTKTFGSYTLDRMGSIYVTCGPSTECDYPIGNYNFVATYTGDSSFNKSTVTLPFSVTQGKANYSLTLSSSTPPAGATDIAEVYFDADPLVPPTGTVTITRDDTGATLATGKIGSNGIAKIPFIAQAGSYNVVPSWSGDSNYKPGFVTSYYQLTTTTTGSAKTTIVMTPSGTATAVGGSTKFDIAVTTTKPVSGAPYPTGTVNLHTDQGQQTVPLTLVGGHASTFIEWSGAGPITVNAEYDGDANYAGSVSGFVTINIAKATPTVQMTTLSNYVLTGTQTSVSAILASPFSSSQATSPTGTIQFMDSVNGAASVLIGSAQPVNTGNGGVIIATVAPVLAAGSHTITAAYSGDTNWNGAKSAVGTPIVVTSPSFTATATPDPLNVTAGETAAITVSTQSILGFSSQIALACGGTLPVGVTCNSTTTTPGASATLSLTTTAPGVTATTAANRSKALWGFSGTMTLAGLFLICIPNRRRFANLSVVLIAFGILCGVVGCGGSSGPKPTTLALTSSSTKVASGASVTLQATVQSTNSSSDLKGTVAFYDGTTMISSAVAPENGVASIKTSALSVGTHAITAKYSGDNHDSASISSDVLQQTVTGKFTVTVNATSGGLSQTMSVPAMLQ